MSSLRPLSRYSVLHEASKDKTVQDGNHAQFAHAPPASCSPATDENFHPQRRLRRRAGSLNLKASTTSLQSSSYHTDVQNSSLSSNVSADALNQPLSPTWDKSPYKQQSSAQKGREKFKLQIVSSEETTSLYRSSSPVSQQLVIFKPIKRLPHQQSHSIVRIETPSPSFIQMKLADQEQNKAAGVGGASPATSTISLSQFPQPPLFKSRPPALPLKTSPSLEDTTQASLAKNKQTLYFFRGASFDLLNPHNSFGLHKIEDETPAEQEIEPRDYFTISTQRDNSGTGRVSSSPMTTVIPKEDAQEHKPLPKCTPQRSLFDDLPSAYNSIRSRSGHQAGAFETALKTTKPQNGMPLPTPPKPSKLARQSAENLTIEAVSPLPLPAEKKSPRKSISAAFRQRLSAVFSGRKFMEKQPSTSIPPTYQKPKSDSKDEFLTPDENGAELSLIFGYADGTTSARNTKSISNINEISPSKNGDEVSRSSYAYESHLAPSAATEQSVAPVAPLSPLRQSPCSFRNHVEKVSSNVNLIDMYAYAISDQEKKFESFSRVLDDGLHQDNRVNDLSTNSTIGEILDQYHQDALLFQFPASPTSQLSSKEDQSLANSAHDLVDTHMALANRFDFGPYYKRNQFSNPEPNSNHVRQATTRALLASATAPPSRALPSDPSNLKTLESNGEVSGLSDSTSIANSEIDTRKLLLLSENSIERARGYPIDDLSTKPEKVSTDNGAESSEINHTKQYLYLPQFDQDYRQNRRQGEDDGTYSSNIKYLRHMNSMNNITGNVFVLRNSSSLPDRSSEAPRCSQDEHNSKRGAHELATPTKRPRSQPTGGVAGRQTPVQADCAPIAAFNRSSVVPGFLRFSPSPEQAKSSDHILKSDYGELSPSISSSSDCSYQPGFADDQDWETIPESRPTLKSISIGPDHASSLAENSSYESLNTFRNICLHPGDGRYQHTYRLRRSPSSSEDPILMPSYDFRDGAGFPYRNALTPPNPAIYTYRHPLPLSQTHSNPFTSSPPQFDTGSQSRFSARERTPCGPPTRPEPETPTQTSNIPTRSNLKQANHLSIVHEQTGESRASDLERDSQPPESVNANQTTNKFIVTTVDSSDWISYVESNDGKSQLGSNIVVPRICSFDCDIEKGASSYALPKNAVDAAIVRILRKDDPRMASSPLSRSNSFNKLSYLGPKANVTGSPNGTGMHEAGSSLIGSSSPLNPVLPLSIAHHKPSMEDCTSPSSADANPSRPSLFVRHIRSPLVNYNQTHEDSATYRHAMQKTRTQDNIPEQGVGLREALLSVGRTSSNKYFRRAVSSQKGLIDMKLAAKDDVQPPDPVIGSETTNFFDDFSYQDTAEFRNGYRLLPYRHKACVTASNPRIIERYRSPSSHDRGLAKRKQKISWAVFGVLLFLPPLLVVFGHGYMDSFGGMLYLSKGEISHFGRRQKCIAKWVGYFVTISIVVAVTIALIVIETTSNNLPRD